MAIISKPSISQEFLGIKVDGKIKDVVEAFKIKEFTAYENISPDGSILLMGQAGGNQVGLVIAYTPKKK